MRKFKNRVIYIYLNAKTAFNSQYTYKTASVLNFITQIILILAQYFLWAAIYENTSNVSNFSFQDMITYIVISFSIGRLYPFDLSGKYGKMVKDGSVIHSLLKPIHIEYQLLTEALGNLLYKIIFTAAPILLTGYLFLDVRLNLNEYRLFIVALFFISAYAFIFILELTIGVLSYYTNSLWGINNFKSSIISILSGKILPLNFYPAILKNAIYYIPFSTMYFIPINILMNKHIDNITILFIILWISTLFMFVLYNILSRIMIKKIMIQGG